MDEDKAGRMAKWLFFGGTSLCLGVMFLILTPNTLAHIDRTNHLDGKPVPADVVRGQEAWHQYACMECHTILGDGTQYAPELGRIAITRDDAFLKAWVRRAHDINPNSAMPSFPAMSEAQASDLVAFLTFTSKVNLPLDLWAEMKAKHDQYDPRAYQPEHNPFALSYWPPRPMNADAPAAGAAATTASDPRVAEGEQLFHQNPVASCQSCHTVGGQGGNIGPDLSDLAKPARQSRFGQEVDETFLAKKLVDPAADVPAKTSVMPSFKSLSDRQRGSLVAYLRTLGR